MNGDWRKLLHEVLCYNLYLFPNIIKMKSRRVSWKGHRAHGSRVQARFGKETDY
jgi:hypothetical protein